MARAIWKGSISFGLVSIPVELHTAVRDHRPGAMGILLVKATAGVEVGPPREAPDLVPWLMERKAHLEATWLRLLAETDTDGVLPERAR